MENLEKKVSLVGTGQHGRLAAMFRIVSDASIRLVYIGPAVDDGSMDIRDLAPALLAMGDACQEANRILNGADVEMTVRVQSDFRTGSFDVLIHVTRTILGAATDLLTGNPKLNANDILTYLGFFGLSVPGVITFWQWLKKESPKRTIIMGDNSVYIEKMDGSSMTLSANTARLADDPQIRKTLPKVFSPLEQNGIVRAEARREDATVTASVTEDDISAMTDVSSITGEPAEQVVNDVTAPAVLEVFRPILKPSLQGRYTWTFTDGEHPFSVQIDDQNFLNQVERGQISFKARDQLKVELHTKQLRTPDGKLRTEQRIVHVDGIYHAGDLGTQISLLPPPKDQK